MRIGNTGTAVAGAAGLCVSVAGITAMRTGVAGTGGLGALVLGTAIVGMTVCLVAILRFCIVGMQAAAEAMHRRRLRRNPPSAIAAAIIRRLTTEWPTVTISKDIHPTRSETVVTLPGGAALSIMTRSMHGDGQTDMTLAQYMNGDTGTVSAGPAVTEMKRLEDRDAEHIAACFQILQRRTIAAELGMEDDGIGSIENAIAAIVQERGLLAHGTDKAATDFSTQDKKAWDLPGKPIGLQMRSSDKETGRTYGLYAVGKSFGAIRIRYEGITEAFARHAHMRLAGAFLSDEKPLGMIPAFVGNARAARLAQLARQALTLDPDLTDASGAPVHALVEDHLPRLIERHRKAALTAETREMASVDADLDRGLDEVAQAVGEALEKVRDRARDDLREQVRFLETRNGKGGLGPL